jgi:phospholipid/cholesterol/gamma-HCH transport system substrate-binding protein
METRANYVLIGSFVLLGAAALMLFVVWVSRASFTRDYDTYDVLFEGAVNGLTEGGEVRFNGIKVGEVRRLSLDREDPNKVIARIRIDGQTPVRTDSIAQLDFLGITGVTFIQIRAGTATLPLLEDVDPNPIPVIRSERTALDELFQGGQDFLTVAGDTLNRLQDVLSDENLMAVASILRNVDTATAKISADDGLIDNLTIAIKSVDEAAKAVDEAAKAIDSAAKTVDGAIDPLAADIDQLMAEIKPAIADARAAIANVNGAVSQINRDLAPSAGRAIEQLTNAAADLQGLVMQVQGLATAVEQNPSQFIYQQPLPAERQ